MIEWIMDVTPSFRNLLNIGLFVAFPLLVVVGVILRYWLEDPEQ